MNALDIEREQNPVPIVGSGQKRRIQARYEYGDQVRPEALHRARLRPVGSSGASILNIHLSRTPPKNGPC